MRGWCFRPQQGPASAPWASGLRLYGQQIARKPLPCTRLPRVPARTRGWQLAATSAAAPPNAPPPATSTAPCSTTASWLQDLQQAAVEVVPDSSAVEVDVSGTALHMGLEMAWSLAFDQHGSFIEGLASPQMTCNWGYDAAGSAATHDCHSSTSATASSGISGSPGSSYFRAGGLCWASDDAGCPRQMQLDDEEALLLSTWVRTGAWVLPSVAARLDITAAQPPKPAAGASSSNKATAADGTAWLELRLKGGGQVTVLLEMCTASWRPRTMRVQLAGDEELWRLSDWRQWQPGLWLAGSMTQSSASEGGVENTYHVTSLQLRQAPNDSSLAAVEPGSSSNGSGCGISSSASVSSSSSSRFAPPPAPPLPADASFLPGVPEEVPAWHTISGHSLVEPLLNGRHVGYFIFDTGASGLVLDPSVADSLGLEAFGELQVTSMVGKVASRFRRAATFQLGPLLIRRPLFMELPCWGLVSGLPEGAKVAGIVGHDVLRRAVVHVPPHPRRGPCPVAAATSHAVDSPAAAVAASMAVDRARRSPLQFSMRLQHPESLSSSSDDATQAGAAAENGSVQRGSGSAASSAAGSSASAPASGAQEPAVPIGQQVAATASSSSSTSTSSSSSTASSSHNSSTEISTSSRAGARSAIRPLSRPSSGTQVLSTRSQQQQRAAGASQRLEWLPLVMVAGLPHVELELMTGWGRRHRGLFMLDSGAGGFDVIVNPKAAQSLQLGEYGGPTGTTQIKGIGGGAADRLSARRCQLAEARLGPATFRPVTAVYHPTGSDGSGGGLLLSRHTSGIVCADLLGRCSLLFDYARMRMAVVHAPSAPF